MQCLWGSPLRRHKSGEGYGLKEVEGSLQSVVTLCISLCRAHSPALQAGCSGLSSVVASVPEGHGAGAKPCQPPIWILLSSLFPT